MPCETKLGENVFITVNVINKRTGSIRNEILSQFLDEKKGLVPYFLKYENRLLVCDLLSVKVWQHFKTPFIPSNLDYKTYRF